MLATALLLAREEKKGAPSLRRSRLTASSPMLDRLFALLTWGATPEPTGIKPINTHRDPYVRVCETIRSNTLVRATETMRGGRDGFGRLPPRQLGDER